METSDIRMPRLRSDPKDRPIAGSTYRSLILHVGRDDRSVGRLAVASNLAERFQARVIGVGAETYPAVYASPEAAFIQEAALSTSREQAEHHLDDARRRFEGATSWLGERAEWRRSVGFPAEAVARHARAADLVVASRRASEDGDVYRYAAAADLVMNVGRPVLVVPDGSNRLNAETIVIGWKDAREARRAVADAMPLLQRAQRVLVVELFHHGEPAEAIERTSDVADALRRQGVNAREDPRPCSDAGAATDLLRVAAESASDLIVVGGYGHSRLREWIFGGVTRNLLRDCDRFVLMSH